MHLLLVESIAAPCGEVFDLLAAMIIGRAGRRRDSKPKLGSALVMRVPVGQRMVVYEGSITAYDDPSYLALNLHNQTQSLSIQFRFQADETAHTTVECNCELRFAGRFQYLNNLKGRIVRRPIETRLHQLLDLIKMIAESGSLKSARSTHGPLGDYKGLSESAAPGVH